MADVNVELRTVGPFALRRTVRFDTSANAVRLELARGLELGVGMPKWLRMATAFIDEEQSGVLTIRPGEVRLAPTPGAEASGVWRFDGRLLGYVGLPDPVAYGAVTWAGRPVGELLAPRLHTYRAAFRGGAPIWRGVASAIDGPTRGWMLTLTALVMFCAAVGEEWYDHQPGRRTD